MFVLGHPAGRPADGRALREVGMSLEMDGATVSVGAGAACLGHPLPGCVVAGPADGCRGRAAPRRRRRDDRRARADGAAGAGLAPCSATIQGLGTVRTSAGRTAMTIEPWPVAIIGSGNIGTDLMIKVLRDVGDVCDGGDGRHRSRRPTGWRGPPGWASPTTADGRRGPAGDARVRRRQAGVRRHLGRRPPWRTGRCSSRRACACSTSRRRRSARTACRWSTSTITSTCRTSTW